MIFITILMMNSAWAEAPTQAKDQIAALRAKLTPVVESILKERCGPDCPGFRIDPVFKKTTPATADDIGFTTPVQEERTQEIKSVSVAVLVSEKVSTALRDNLKQVLAYRLTNESDIPLSVVVHPIGALPAAADKTPPSPQTLEYAKAMSWPVVMVFLGILGFLAVLFSWRARKQLQREHLASLKPEKTEPALPPPPSYAAELKLLLQTGLEDLKWWIEELALENTAAEKLSRIFSLLSAREITTQISLSRAAVKALSQLSEKPSTPASYETFQWFKENLERAHWKRLQSEHSPLGRFSDLPSRILAECFSELPQPLEKAALLSALPAEQWPELLARLNSDQRVKIGLSISDFQNLPREEKRIIEKRTAHLTAESIEEIQISKKELLEDYTLYLSEKEGQALWSTLTSSKKTRSLDSLLIELSPAELLEICMGLDAMNLKILLMNVSSEAQAKIRAGLPKPLLGRLNAIQLSSAAASDEARLMQARAALLRNYAKFSSAQGANA